MFAAFMYVCAPCVRSALRDQKASDPLELELPSVSYPAGTGNRACSPLEEQQVLLTTSHLSRPEHVFVTMNYSMTCSALL